MVTVFQALSTVLYGHQEKHQELCNHLVQKVYVFSTTSWRAFEKMANHGTWATHLEINAAACFLQIPIYVCTQRTETLIYYWELYKPLFTELAYSEKPAVHTNHIEVAHLDRCHYEVITMMDGNTPKQPPTLSKSVYCVDLTWCCDCLCFMYIRVFIMLIQGCVYIVLIKSHFSRKLAYSMVLATMGMTHFTASFLFAYRRIKNSYIVYHKYNYGRTVNLSVSKNLWFMVRMTKINVFPLIYVARIH